MNTIEYNKLRFLCALLLIIGGVAGLFVGSFFFSDNAPDCKSDQVYVMSTQRCADAADHGAHEG